MEIHQKGNEKKKNKLTTGRNLSIAFLLLFRPMIWTKGRTSIPLIPAYFGSFSCSFIPFPPTSSSPRPSNCVIIAISLFFPVNFYFFDQIDRPKNLDVGRNPIGQKRNGGKKWNWLRDDRTIKTYHRQSQSADWSNRNPKMRRKPGKKNPTRKERAVCRSEIVSTWSWKVQWSKSLASRWMSDLKSELGGKELKSYL